LLTLEQVLGRMYASEINASISNFWDAGWDIWLGDSVNGWREKTAVETPAEIAPALHAMILKHFPDSAYARGIAERRPDGWPLCPVCGTDEVYSRLNWDGQGERPPLQQYIDAGLACYACNWSSTHA
jgi:hypothetical protein